MSKAKWKPINGPARILPSAGDDITKAPEPGTNEFNVHFLVDGSPVCGWQTTKKWGAMEVPVKNIATWKLCPGCFKAKGGPKK